MLASWREQSRAWPMDYWLLGFIITLVMLGLMMVASSSVAISDQRFGHPDHYIVRQLISVAIGLFAAYLVLLIPLSMWEDNRGKLFLFGVFSCCCPFA